jgi:hypothetical protein
VPACTDAINDHNEAAATADVLNLKALVIGNGIVNETEQSTAKYVKSTNADSVGPGAGLLHCFICLGNEDHHTFPLGS